MKTKKPKPVTKKFAELEQAYLNKPQHTPTPWSIELGSIVKHVRDGRDPLLCEMYDSDFVTPQEQAENAAFIVKAVNSHDALVEVVNHFLFLACNKYSDSVWRNAYDMARKAIDKAEGK